MVRTRKWISGSVVAFLVLVLLAVVGRRYLSSGGRITKPRVENALLDADEPAETNSRPLLARNWPVANAVVRPAQVDKSSDPFVKRDPMNAQSYQAALEVTKGLKLERTWQSGNPDPNWTAQMEGYLSSEISKKKVAGKVSAVECRTTVCRVTLEFDSIEHLSTVNWLEYPPSYEGYRSTYVGDGQFLARVYILNKETSLEKIFARSRRR